MQSNTTLWEKETIMPILQMQKLSLRDIKATWLQVAGSGL